jgi:hypothetical protein
MGFSSDFWKDEGFADRLYKLTIASNLCWNNWAWYFATSFTKSCLAMVGIFLHLDLKVWPGSISIRIHSNLSGLIWGLETASKANIFGTGMSVF